MYFIEGMTQLFIGGVIFALIAHFIYFGRTDFTKRQDK